MKITRFINGKKLHQKISDNIVIENELITGTIEKINARMLRQGEANKDKSDFNE